MKFKRFLLLTLMVLTLLTAVGCGSKTEATSDSTTTESAAKETTAEQVTMPEGRPQLVGKIKDVVGNEVTIYRSEMNADAAAQKPTDTNQSEEKAANQNANNQNTDNQNTKVPGQPRTMALNFTEETETITIPVGTPVVTAQRGGGTTEVMELSDLEAEQILMIWQQDDTITFVQVMGGNRTNQNTEQNQENRQGPPGGFPGGGPMGGGNRQP